MKINIIYQQQIYLILLFSCFIASGQEAAIKPDLPTVLPPSPTVAGLMKFEEVPVSNYTGVPDISIPLFSTDTHSKEINLDIALKYHSGVGANDVAGDVGLGWSLFAGGTISRMVRGLPDEILRLDGYDNGPGKAGLYQTDSGMLNHNNYYYQHGNNFPQFVYDTPYVANKYVWNIVETGKFDTEHDLWQFNFMGFSGRFYIKKNLSTNQLEVIPLDDYRIKIINNYSTVGNNDFIPTGFTIYDDNGFKYVFETIETTITSQAITNVYIHNSTSSLSEGTEYRSAFHLAKIYDTNNNLLIEYNLQKIMNSLNAQRVGV
ncbi:MAG TPA: hypothetical protein VF677_03490 [Flavobacterium sp.]|jgi:hypothetical protein